MKFTKYVDPFYGNFEPDLPEPNETASKWFFLKAQAGNTTPASVRPFGMVSACAYTGGYPTGYGPYASNSFARPKTIMDKNNMTAMGFSHFHQSGTGYICEFYNYSVVTPISGEIPPRLTRFSLKNEKATPGYYACKLGDINCEITVTDTSAIYNFTFKDDKNSVVLDPALNGFFKDSDTPQAAFGDIKNIKAEDKNTVLTAADFGKGFTLYTALYCTDSDGITIKDNRAVLSINGKKATVYVAFSFKDENTARRNLENAKQIGFKKAKKQSEKLWEKALSAIKISGNKGKFYSNLYHCFIKPVDLTDNSAFFDGNCFCDLATMWDMSKTHLPLVFTLFPDLSARIVDSFLSFYDFYGYFPNECLLTKSESSRNIQARALTVNSIYDAYLRGIKFDYHRALAAMVGELSSEVNKEFLSGGVVSEYPSQTLDLCIAAYTVYEFAAALGEKEIADKFYNLSKNWVNLYDKTTGVLTEDGLYYEGCNLNYSFRLLPFMKERIELVGNEKFEKMLDDFFGFTKDPIKQCLDDSDKATLAAGEARCGFEGFNNETDMETPYNYCFIGKSEKTAEIIRSGDKYMFGQSGRGALCGNEDSGALSSLYVVNSLGIFPVMGQNKIILGSPSIKKATVKLNNGKTLKITTKNQGENSFIPLQIKWQGSVLKEPFLTVTSLMQGGKLEFIMGDK